MFTPKNIERAFKEIFELASPDIQAALVENYHEEMEDISPRWLAKAFNAKTTKLYGYRAMSRVEDGMTYYIDIFLSEKSVYQKVILEEQNQQLMLYAHDAKKHLAAIQALTDDSRINGYLTQLSNQLRDYAKNCHSGNKLLDVMIHKYQTACDIQGIELEYDVKLCNLAGIADLDLVAILGNLMDNALRAAAESKGKNIRLETLKRNGYSVVIVANSCDTAPIHQARRLFSTKSNPTGHGFGLKSAECAVKQYMGDLDWNFDISARLFTVTVMLDERKKQS